MLGECRRDVRQRAATPPTASREVQRPGGRSRCIIRRGWRRGSQPRPSTATTCSRSAASSRSSGSTCWSSRDGSGRYADPAGRRRRRHAARERRARGGRGRASPIASTFLGAVDDEQLLELYRGRARRSSIRPFDEDFGYVTLEAFLARKPVDHRDRLRRARTSSSSTASTASSCAPEPEAIADAINPLAARSRGARRRSATPATTARARDHLGRRDREAGRDVR